MKSKVLMLVALLTALFLPCALAESGRAAADYSVPQTGPAATLTTAELLSTPQENANVLMRYYPGVRVEVAQCVDAEYVRVNVGSRPGTLTGYMRAADLAYTEYGVRSVHGVLAKWNGAAGLPLYTYMDALSQKIGDAFNFFRVLGVNGEGWMHVMLDGAEETGFAYRGSATSGMQLDVMPYVDTAPTQDELSEEEAIECAIQQIMADGGFTNNGSRTVTREELEACVPELRVLYYENEPLTYMVAFRDTRTGDLLATVDLFVEGKTVLGHSYGNG